MSGPGIISARRSEYNGGGDLRLSISNGHGGVALGIAEAGALGAHEDVSFTPEEARTAGIALLNAAQNVLDGVWMGPTDSRERALFALGVVGPQGTEASAEEIAERVLRDFAGHDGTPVMALGSMLERKGLRPSDIVKMIQAAVRMARQ